MALEPKPLPAHLPFATQARVSRDKVKLYMLSPDHDEGNNKARLWRSALGYDRSHYGRLQDDLQHAAANAAVLSCKLTSDGWMLWRTRGLLVGPNSREFPVRINWMTLAPGTSPRLTTAWPDVKAA